MTLTVIATVLFAPVAAAADCGELESAFDEASPVSTAKAWSAWSACDADAAGTKAGDALGKMLAGDDAYAALPAMIGLGLGDDVTQWVQGQEPSNQSKAIAALGEGCADNEPVQNYLLGQHEALGGDFWKQRWYRAFDDCPAPAVQEWLGSELDAAAGDSGVDDNRFTGLLEVYARNLQGDAVPKLKELAGKVKTDERKGYVVSAFADAANVGSESGMNSEVALAAVDAIKELAPTLEKHAVENARATLTSLGAEANADSMARYRWADRFEGGVYSYSVVAFEYTTCKNGKKMGTMHKATFTEPGGHWPEQLKDIVEPKITQEWGLGGFAKKCKGEGEVKVQLPEVPFATADDRDSWLDQMKKVFAGHTDGYDKTEVQDHGDFSL